jgi:hypothetical protein
MSLSLEQRIAALVQEVADLKAQREAGPSGKDWRRTIGMFTDNPGMQEIFAEAMKLREADRKKARRPKRRKQPIRS